MSKNYYDILGVSKSASEAEIKKAFRKKAHELHPDKKTGDEAKVKEVNEAYQVLSDKQKRSQYDQFGQTFSGAGSNGGAYGGQQGGFGGFDFSNFDFSQAGGGGFGFEDVFGDLFGGGRRRQASGKDIQVDVEITLKEAFSGVKKSVSLRHKVVCGNCGGNGAEKGSAVHECTTCHGRGQVYKNIQTMLGVMQQAVTCQACGGRGKTFDKKCHTCHGDGRVTKEETIEVDIPAGIDDGQGISVAGKGEAGEAGYPAGDLIVVIHIRPEKGLRRQGQTIYSEREISISEAALGGKITVATLEGEVTMKIPAGTQPGEVFRLRDKGMPSLRQHSRGDQMVTVKVVVPKKLSRKAKEALEILAQEEK